MHSQLKLPGVLTHEAREPQALLTAAHSLLSVKEKKKGSHFTFDKHVSKEKKKQIFFSERSPIQAV